MATVSVKGLTMAAVRCNYRLGDIKLVYLSRYWVKRV